MRLDGYLSKENFNPNFAFRTSGVTSYYQGQTYSNGLSFSIRDRINKTLTLDRSTINIGIFQLRVAGEITRNTEAKGADVDLNFMLNAS